MKMTNKRFTLIELIIVIVVIGILAGMALPKFMGVQRDANAANLKNDCDVLQTASSLIETTRDQDAEPYGTTAAVEEVSAIVDVNLKKVLTDNKVTKVAPLSEEEYKKHLSKLPKTGVLTDYRVIVEATAEGEALVGQIVYNVGKGVRDGEGNIWYGASNELSLDAAEVVVQP